MTEKDCAVVNFETFLRSAYDIMENIDNGFLYTFGSICRFSNKIFSIQQAFNNFVMGSDPGRDV